MPGIQEEIKNAFEQDFPPCEGNSNPGQLRRKLTVQPDWTEVPVVGLITQIVARVSSRMFGGTVLSENREWEKPPLPSQSTVSLVLKP